MPDGRAVVAIIGSVQHPSRNLGRARRYIPWANRARATRPSAEGSAPARGGTQPGTAGDAGALAPEARRAAAPGATHPAPGPPEWPADFSALLCPAAIVAARTDFP